MSTSGGSSGGGGVSSVKATDTSIVVAGTTADPTIATGTLDVIAADHPPAADVAMNSHKITGLADGAAAGEAATYGQLPASVVNQFNTRTGDVTLTLADLEALYAAVGDLLAGTGSGTAELLPVGNDGDVLTADSTQTAGIKWAAAAAAGLTVHEVQATADTSLSANILTTVLTSPSLAVGTWLIFCTAIAIFTSSGDEFVLGVADGTATATYPGQVSAQHTSTAVTDRSTVVVVAVAVVTTAGTVIMQAQDTNGCTVGYIDGHLSETVTAMTCVKIA